MGGLVCRNRYTPTVVKIANYKLESWCINRALEIIRSYGEICLFRYSNFDNIFQSPKNDLPHDLFTKFNFNVIKCRQRKELFQLE